MTNRIAEVYLHGTITPEVVAAYLPQNYKIIAIGAKLPDGESRAIIAGVDNHGWTLDGYVIPRLGSGMIAAKEITVELA